MQVIDRAYFRKLDAPREEVFMPRPEAYANWGEDRLQGPAVAGLLARAAEREGRAVQPSFVSRRASFELFTAARNVETRTRTEVVRKGPRILVVDSFLIQGGETIARAHVYLYRPGEEAAEQPWQPVRNLPEPPPTGIDTDSRNRCYRSEGTQWSGNAYEVLRSGRKQAWQGDIATVLGEDPSGFERVSAASDLASFVTHWNEKGVRYINADVNVILSRCPVGSGVGLAALDWTAHCGVSAGAATLFDGEGALGVAMVSAIAQTRVRVEIGPEGFVVRKLL